jgi:hypothetical protein
MPSKGVWEGGECPVQLGGGHSRALVSMATGFSDGGAPV